MKMDEQTEMAVHTEKTAEKEANADKFTAPMNIKLIELVREEPMLYDKTNSFYKNNQLKTKKWHSIATILSEMATRSLSSAVSVEDCIKRWKGLKDRFTKERGRLKILASECGLVNAVPRFHLYRDLLFLDAHVTRRKIRKRKLLSSDVDPELQTQNQNTLSAREDEPEEVLLNSNQSGLLLDPETGEVIGYEEFVEIDPLKDTSKRKVNCGPSTKIPKTAEQEALQLLSAISNLTSAVVNKSEKSVKDPDLRSFCDSVYYHLLDVEKNKRLKYKLAILQAIEQLHNE